ncbi:MAG: hypothetical protein QF733_05465 [Phycisphaerales bacterium]|jgi:hypothetical protein|nr:hypothetical protein [Phycisphaerales bacterium]
MVCPASPDLPPSNPNRTIRYWSLLQWLMLLASGGLLATLVVWPTIGLHGFWDVLIPAAPALVVVAPGIWRNICPLGTMSQLARRTGWSRARVVSTRVQPRLGLIGVALLLTLVPLRHPWFNQSGLATAALLVTAAVAAVAMGVWLGGKSGWCAGLCPVHAVERLYGIRPVITMTSAHCRQCDACVAPCPDTTPDQRHGIGVKTPARSLASALMIGGFPGFVWGWFQVPDGVSAWAVGTWAWPFGGLVVTLAMYLLVAWRAGAAAQRTIAAVFGAAAVSCYYWFRLPALIGFGPYPGDGMLVQAQGVISPVAVSVMQGGVTLFFFWWMVFRRPAPRAWMRRPQPASQATAVTIGMS